jgi:hypothetical protein
MKKLPAGSLKPIHLPTTLCIYDVDNPRIEPLRDEIDFTGNQKQRRANIRAIIAARDCEGPTSTSYKGLKRSIYKVGLRMPIEVVKKANGYLVTSGNTRLCIYEDLARDFPHDKRWQKIPAKIMPSSSNNEKEVSTITEHLCRGRDWPAQATAHKIYTLITKKVFDPATLAEMTGTTEESLMLQKDAYDDFQRFEKPLRKKQGVNPRTDQFSIWVEAQSASIVRSLSLLSYKGLKSHSALAKLIIDEKFTSANHIRSLPKIVSNKSSLNALYNDNSGEALKVLEQSAIRAMNMFELIDALHDEFLKWFSQNRHLKKPALKITNEYRSMKSFLEALRIFFK